MYHKMYYSTSVFNGLNDSEEKIIDDINRSMYHKMYNSTSVFNSLSFEMKSNQHLKEITGEASVKQKVLKNICGQHFGSQMLEVFCQKLSTSKRPLHVQISSSNPLKGDIRQPNVSSICVLTDLRI